MGVQVRSLFHPLLRSLTIILMIGVMGGPLTLSADQAQYFYDELGRLVGVVDGQGNAAVYNYDGVGNLLSIQRFTTGTMGIGIFIVAPASGQVGANVTIRGFGFSPTATDNQVKFNGTNASVVSASPTALVVTVPTGATTGSVTVTNTNGTATSPSTFTVLVPPIIVGIDPTRVPQGASMRIAIQGFNLADATAVTFTQAGLSAAIVSGATSSTLPVNVTATAAVPPGSYAFSVTTPGGVAQSGTITVTVTVAVPSVGLGVGSVFMPSSGQPTGPSVGMGEASVVLPFPAQTSPSGPSVSVTPPTSVRMP